MSTDFDDLDRTGYPRREAVLLQERATERFREKLAEYGPGKHWLDDPVDYHIIQAIKKVRSGRSHAVSGNLDDTRREYGDALNHLLFSLELASKLAATPDPCYDLPPHEYFGSCVVCGCPEDDFVRCRVLGDLTVADVNYDRMQEGLGALCQDCIRDLEGAALPTSGGGE